MSAACTPEPDDRRDPHPAPGNGAGNGGGLSARDHRILDDIAGHENGADPSFVARLREPARPAAKPVTERVIQILVVGVVLALILPTAWLVVGLLIVVMVVGPGLLAWYGHRLEKRGRGPATDETR